MSPSTSRPLSGAEFRLIRTTAGYSAREIAQQFALAGLPITVGRSLYRIERLSEVPSRYSIELRRILSAQVFDSTLDQIRADNARNFRSPKLHRTLHSGNQRGKSPNYPFKLNDRFDSVELISFLNLLPSTSNTHEWIIQFRKLLNRLFHDVDHIVLNINTGCDLINPESYVSETAINEAIDELGGKVGSAKISNLDPNVPTTTRLMEQFRKQNYPLDDYHPPIAIDILFRGTAYLGSVFLFRLKTNPPSSLQTKLLLEAIREFLVFALSDVVARAQCARPLAGAYHDAIQSVNESVKLSQKEKQVITLQFYGYSYQQIADALELSLDTVRKHTQSIYRKTRTHGVAELFAKYLTPRMGF